MILLPWAQAVSRFVSMSRVNPMVDCGLSTDLDLPETLWPQRKFLSHERQSTGNRLHSQYHHSRTVNIQLKIFKSAIIAFQIAKRQNGNILISIGSTVAKEGHTNHIKE